MFEDLTSVELRAALRRSTDPAQSEAMAKELQARREAELYEEAIKTPKPAEQGESIGAKGGSSDCFIATACYGSNSHPDVAELRRWRDVDLYPTFVGPTVIRLYYTVGPVLARRLSRDKMAARIIRDRVLVPLAQLLRARRC